MTLPSNIRNCSVPQGLCPFVVRVFAFYKSIWKQTRTQIDVAVGSLMKEMHYPRVITTVELPVRPHSRIIPAVPSSSPRLRHDIRVLWNTVINAPLFNRSGI